MKLLTKSLMILGAIALLGGCASYPDLVSVPENTKLTEYSSASADDAKLVGQQARWSGVIADIKNEVDKTRFDVLYYPAKSNGRPDLKDDPVGRFRVYVNGFLDPEVFKKGKSVTALGEIKSSESQKIDEYEYVYPTLTNAKLHLWKNSVAPARVQFHYGWYGYNPRWYWQGGTRHLYIIGGNNKIKPTGVVKSKDKKQ